MHAKSVFTAILFATSSVLGDGINCEGSSNCEAAREGGASLQRLAQAMINGINAGKGNDFYNTGAQIACTSDSKNSGATCAFYQFNGASGTLSDARNRVQQITDHGCELCGSVPLAPGNPDTTTGCLTINYVSEPCCKSTDVNFNGCLCAPA